MSRSSCQNLPAASRSSDNRLRICNLPSARHASQSRTKYPMQLIETEIPGVKILAPKKHGDHRGFFSEVWSKKALAEVGITAEFVQDNHSMSAAKGVLRGLHYQLPPMAQDKLVRVVHGAILDVAVDIRRGSPTFGQHITAIISAENW